MEVLIFLVVVSALILGAWLIYCAVRWYCGRIAILNLRAIEQYEYTPVDAKKTMTMLACWALAATAIICFNNVRVLTFDLSSPEINGLVSAVISLVGFRLIFHRIESKTSPWIAAQAVVFLSINAFSMLFLVAGVILYLFYRKEKRDQERQENRTVIVRPY